MALEPITRKEKIIAGENLEPITRLEKFLKEYGGSGGSGGGGSSDAVLYTPQTLTEVQKKQARENVDAAGEFVVNLTFDSTGNPTLDKTFVQIKESADNGKRVFLRLLSGNSSANFIPLVEDNTTRLIFAAAIDGNNSVASLVLRVADTGQISFDMARGPMFNTGGEMLQLKMSSDPTEAMHIATKKYVDDKECILKSTTPGSTKKFKMTVDDNGNISATEVT